MTLPAQYNTSRSETLELSSIEVYARALSVCEMLAVIEAARYASSVISVPAYREMVRLICANFSLDEALSSLIPHKVWSKPLAVTCQTEPYCFARMYEALFAARKDVLLPLLSRTYSEFPPPAFVAYKRLNLSEVERLLERIADVISDAASAVDRCERYDRDFLITDRRQEIAFMLESLFQMSGIKAETYWDAVEQYVKFIGRIFPGGERPKEPSFGLARIVSKLSRV